ncbi:MAG TPA: ABC transporter permease [Actinomycetota bacterium]
MNVESDRGAFRLVARREFVERARDRSFIVSTAITLLVLVGFILVNAFLGGETRFELGVVGEGSRATARAVEAAAPSLGFAASLETFDSESQANAALRDGSVDAVLVDGRRVLVVSEAPEQLLAVIQVVSARERTARELEAAGLTPEEVERALDAPPLPVQALEPLDEQSEESSVVAFVGVLALYGQLLSYGYWVASGVVEEKASRVVEVLLATIRPKQLLRGKILGIGLLGLCQLLLIGVVGLTVARAAGTLTFPAGALAAVGAVLLWFVLGFFFYSSLFAVAGAIVPRQEDLQTTMTPLTILVLVSFLIGISAVGDPSTTLATVASLLPFSAPLVMPSRMVLGQLSVWQGLLSAGIIVGATFALIPLATRMYSNAVLRTGRVRILDVLRGER